MWVARLISSRLTVTLPKTSDVFACPSFPHDFLALSQEFSSSSRGAAWNLVLTLEAGYLDRDRLKDGC